MARILLIAPSTDGTDVGEAWVAFQWAKGLSERHEVTLLTFRGPGRPSAVPQLPRARVIEWDQPPIASISPRFNSLLKPWYPLFHRHARSWIRKALAGGERFDVAHQPVPVAMRYPSPLRGSNIPYVIGPVGGSLSSPAGFDDQDTAPWYVGLRQVDAWRLKHDWMLRRSYRCAEVVLGIGPYVGPQLATLRLRDLRFMSETGVIGLPEPTDRTGRAGPVSLLFVGRLIRTKGARDAIAAMSHLRDLPVVLDIVGDGFDRSACEHLAAALGLEQRVRFHGALPRNEVDDYYRNADVFVFPSYREPGGNVQFEAMSHGLPLIVSDRGGPANVVNDLTGFRVPPTTPEGYAKDIAEAVRQLCVDPPRRLAMGEAARDAVANNGTWASRITQIESIFAEVIARSTD